MHSVYGPENRCMTCSQVVARIFVETHDMLEKHQSWYQWEQQEDGWETYLNGKVIEKVTRQHDPGTYTAFLIFRVGTFFYKKIGFYNGDGDYEWTGGFYSATKKVRTTETYE